MCFVNDQHVGINLSFLVLSFQTFQIPAFDDRKFLFNKSIEGASAIHICSEDAQIQFTDLFVEHIVEMATIYQRWTYIYTPSIYNCEVISECI